MVGRLYRYDNLKAVLIYLVILGHLARPVVGLGIIGRLVYLFVYLFHMPAFIYILGRFAKPSWKRVRFFVVLYFVFQVLYLVFYNFVLCIHKPFDLFTPMYTLWYLLAVVAYTGAAFWLPDDIAYGKKLLVVGVFTLISIMVGFLPFVGVFLALSRIIVFFPFFLAGKYEIFKEATRRWAAGKAVVWGFISFLFVLLYFLVSSANYLALQNNLCYAEAGSSWVDRAIGLLGAFSFIRFFLYAVPNRKIPVLTSIGQHTLFIFLWHGFLVKLIAPLISPEYAFGFFWGGSVAMLLVLWGCSVGWRWVSERAKRNFLFKAKNGEVVA